MMIKGTYVACKRAGIPYRHSNCFQSVANQLKCMIAVRSVGIYATGLILEGYASKGFHIKAKSCSWGPMAGFVLSDPRFRKQSIEGIEFQRTAIHNSLLKGAPETAVYISDKRRKDLESLGCMRQVGGKMNEMRYSAQDPNSSLSLTFILQRKVLEVSGSHGTHMWAVCYYPKERAMPSNLSSPQYPSANKFPLPVMALVNPDCPVKLRGTYRSAITGDYDLWGVWPSVSDYSPRDKDRRKIPHSERRTSAVAMLTKYGYGDPNFGNTTPRVIQVKDALNEAIQASGYAGGNMVHHGDETGRPFATDIDMSFIAFRPRQDGNAWLIEDMKDYGCLLKECIQSYSISLNGCWQKALNFTASKGNNFESI